MAAGISPGTTAMYMQRTTSGAAGNGLYTTGKYVRGAAGIGLGTTNKYLVNRNAVAGNNWAKAHIQKSWAQIQMNPLVV